MNHTTDTGLSCARRIQYFGLAMWIYVVLQFVTGFVGALPALLGINTTWLVLLGGTVVAGLPALAVALQTTHTKVEGLKTTGHHFVSTYLRYVPMMFFWNIAFGLFWQLFQVSDQTLPAAPDPLDMVLMLLIAGFIGPVVEELFFRGFAYNCLKPYGAVFAAVISSLGFSFLHMNFVQGFPVFFFGLMFCAGYERTGSIWLPIALHVTNNTLAVLNGWFPQLVWIMMVLAAGGLVLTVLAAPVIRRDWDALMEKVRLFRCVKKAPAFWLLGILYVLTGIWFAVAA